MSSELEKSRLAIADEVKFDMLAAISELGDHEKQYKAISRNFVCEYPSGVQSVHHNNVSYI